MTALFNCQNPVQAQGYLCVSVGDPLQVALTFGATELQDKDSQLFLLNLYQDREKHVLLKLIRVIGSKLPL